MVVRKTTPAKAASTELANYDDELARRARGSKKIIADVGLGRFISVQGGQLRYNGSPVPDNTMRVVVIDSIMENTFYDRKYDPDDPTPPDCYAFGKVDLEADEDDEIVMRPHPKAHNPQNDTCAGCPQNEWGSADTGRGKACGQRRRLALMTEDGLELIPTAEIAYFKIAVTSVSAWAAYVKQLDSLYPGRPPFCFLTEISVVPDPKTQFKITFAFAGEVDRAYIGALIKKQDSIAEEIVAPYPDMPEAAPAKPAARGKVAGKALAPAGRARKF